MIHDKCNPLLRKDRVTTRQLLHEGRRWLEFEGLADALPDPHRYQDIAMFIERFYPCGLQQFKYDITHVGGRARRVEEYRLRGRG